MHIDSNIKIVLILTIGFALASLLGYLSQRLKLSPILGYLLAGFLIGPYSPGFVADLQIAEQLAEIGVILMMFGVGMHFKWEDLVSVKNIAIPGAIGQTLIASSVCAWLIYMIGWPIETGVVVGLAIGVASTVVLVRLLADNNLIDTPEGHIAIGWLIVEDLLTVIALILLPTIAETLKGAEFHFSDIALSVLFILIKFVLLIAIMFTIGSKFVTYTLFKIARTRSHELFTLTVLALIFVIATGSALLFGASLALGAFIAGMVIGRTDVRHQASANALPMKDTFVVIFFLSVGMLFNPFAIVENFTLFAGVLGIILIIKPLAALLITLFFNYSFKTALIVAVALAQIGEFSFILAEEALKLKILPDEGYDVIVACALISISINPILFKVCEWLRVYGERLLGLLPSEQKRMKKAVDPSLQALVIGYGPIGQNVVRNLEKMGFIPTIIDRNVDTVAKLTKEKRQAVYGDATLPSILEMAHVESTSLLIITNPEVSIAIKIIQIARQMNPNIRILARTKYEADELSLKKMDINTICSEEETIKAFNDAIFKFASQGVLV